MDNRFDTRLPCLSYIESSLLSSDFECYDRPDTQVIAESKRYKGNRYSKKSPILISKQSLTEAGRRFGPGPAF